jgi:hypothetical protein
MVVHFKQATVVFMCVLGLVMLVFASPTLAAPASGGPSVTLSNPNIELNIHGCTTLPVYGEGFLPTSKVLLAVTLPTNKSFPVTPTSVSVAAKGNFFIPLYICNLASIVNTPMGENFLLTAVDTDSHQSVEPLSFNVSIPAPSIYSNASTSPLLNDCGSVVVFGDGFIASTSKANYASISGFEGEGGARLPGGARANVLVNGNIATSVQFCGLKVGDTFSIQATDIATNQHTGYLSFTAIAATPSTPATT